MEKQEGEVRMADSAKDLSTTAVGLMAAYFLPGAVALGAGVWIWDKGGSPRFFLQDGVHFTLGVAVALTAGLLLNALRIAVFSRWLFKEMSYTEEDFRDFHSDIISRLQTAVDEVFRLHQFYSAIFFLLPAISAWWLIKNHNRFTVWENALIVACLIIVWRVIAVCVLERYEFYHQMAKGLLNKTLPGKPSNYKGWIIGILFEWTFWKRYS
jgi:hypothetical protein